MNRRGLFTVLAALPALFISNVASAFVVKRATDIDEIKRLRAALKDIYNGNLSKEAWVELSDKTKSLEGVAFNWAQDAAKQALDGKEIDRAEIAGQFCITCDRDGHAISQIKSDGRLITRIFIPL